MKTITKNILTGVALALALQSVSTIQAADNSPAAECERIRTNRPYLVEISTEVSGQRSSARFFADDNGDINRLDQALRAFEELLNQRPVLTAVATNMVQNWTTGAPDNFIITISYWNDIGAQGHSMTYNRIPGSLASNENFRDLTDVLAEQAQEDEQFEKKARRYCRQLAKELCAIQ